MHEQNFTPGLYDHPLSAAIDQLLARQEESTYHLQPLDPAEAPQRLPLLSTISRRSVLDSPTGVSTNIG